MSVRDTLIPRDQIPAGCRWEGSRWNPGESPRMGDEDTFRLQNSVAYYELADALTEVVNATNDLSRAEHRHWQAINRIRAADSRGEYLQELPRGPWEINGHVVRWNNGNSSYTVEPLAVMDVTSSSEPASMTKILFATAINHCYPVLATNDDGFKADIDMVGSDLDDHVQSADIMNLTPGLWLWEGERRERWHDGKLDIDLIKTQVRPATQQDLDELGFACPIDTVAPPGSFLAGVAADLDKMQPGETMTIRCENRS